jgi:hypothetical protein
VLAVNPILSCNELTESGHCLGRATLHRVQIGSRSSASGHRCHADTPVIEPPSGSGGIALRGRMWRLVPITANVGVGITGESLYDHQRATDNHRQTTMRKNVLYAVRTLGYRLGRSRDSLPPRDSVAEQSDTDDNAGRCNAGGGTHARLRAFDNSVARSFTTLS